MIVTLKIIMGKREMCQKCGKEMKEQSFDSRGYGLSDYKHTYRTFFWVCRCGHSEKEKSESEQII